MEQVTVERYADVPLEFEGELIAEVSTEHAGRERWEEWRIWRVAPKSHTQWVVQRLAKSHDPDVEMLIFTYKCKSPIDVRHRLRRQDREDPERFYMTDSALEALALAVGKDERLREALIERI